MSVLGVEKGAVKMHRPLRGWHAPGHGAGGRTRGRALRAGQAPPVFGLVLTPTPRGPPRPCPTHTLGRGHYAQVPAATRFDLHFKNTPGSTWGPRRTAPPRHRGTTSLGTLGLPQVTQQQQWLQAQKPHEGSPDNTPRPPGRDLGTLWPPQPAGHSRRPPLPQGPRLWPRTHTQTAPTPVKPTSSSNSGWAWQRRAPAPFSSRQEGSSQETGAAPHSISARAAGAWPVRNPLSTGGWRWQGRAWAGEVDQATQGLTWPFPDRASGDFFMPLCPPGAQCRAQSLDSSAIRVTHRITGG